MSGSPIPEWFGKLLGVFDTLHKVTHPSRWGEEKRWREQDEREKAEQAKRDGGGES